MSAARRVVCLSAEAADILIRIGAGERIVGVTAFAKLPTEFTRIPRVSGFDSANLAAIRELRPDLVITYSDVQATIAADLVRAGLTVLATNQTTLAEIRSTILLLGRVVEREKEALSLAEKFHLDCRPTTFTARRPLVYFEEWPDPLITGIGWVDELIEAAGGENAFPSRLGRTKAEQRVVTGEDVIRRNPEIIIASWCGKRVDLDSIRSRTGWASIRAVERCHVYEMDSSIILQPGPVLADGLHELRRLIAKAR